MENVEQTHKSITDTLASADCEVTFTKVDGTERVMKCTLRPEVLPPVVLKEDATPKEPNYNVVTVWDLEKNEWRAFKTANLKNISILA